LNHFIQTYFSFNRYLKINLYNMVMNNFTDEIISGISVLNLKVTGNENIHQKERIVSVMAGTYLLYNGLKKIYKHPFSSFFNTITGSLLICRGVTGICPVYKIITNQPRNIKKVRLQKRP
jgi:hypothetical protein